MNERIQNPDGNSGDVRPGDRDYLQPDTAGSAFKVEVQTAGSTGWAGSGQRFASETAATAYALDLQARWTAVSNFRVIAVPGEPTDSVRIVNRTEAWAERGAPRPDADAPAWRVKL